MTSESALSKDIQYANELYKEQIAHLKQIYQLKTQRLKVQDGTPAAQSLDSQIADIGRQIDANNQLIAQLDRQAVARSRLINLSGDEAALAAKYTAAQTAQQERLTASNEAAAKAAASGAVELKQVQQAYKQLTNAYHQYNSAVKSGNEAGKAYWSQSAQQALTEIHDIEQKLGTLNLEEGVRKKILDLIQQAQNAEATQKHLLENSNNGVSELDQSLDRIGNRLIQMASTMLVLRG